MGAYADEPALPGQWRVYRSSGSIHPLGAHGRHSNPHWHGKPAAGKTSRTSASNPIQSPLV